MTRDQLLSLLRRRVEYAQNGTPAIHPDGARNNPIATYTDPAQFEHERQRIFGRYDAVAQRLWEVSTQLTGIPYSI